MRIAYISLHWPRTVASSVGQKIARQMASWRAAGHEVSFFSHMHTMKEEQELVRGKYFVYAQHHGLVGRIRTEFSRMHAAKELVEAVKAYQPELIYLRWSMYVYPIHRLMDIAPVVVEINTNDVEEHRLLGALPNIYNRLTRGLLLGGAVGHIYPTEEIRCLSAFRKFHKSSVVVTNGLDLSSTPYYPAPKNRQPHLVFIGTPHMPWHGVDKLAALAKNFPTLIIDILGISEIPGIDTLPENLRLHGYLRGVEYENILARADAAIGTLALHRKGMNEAAALKVRDCVARGIPCILPYIDTDLSELESEFFLQIPNKEDNIQTHGKAIHDFVFAMRGRRVPRELIFERIDISVKEAQRLEFFQRVIEESKAEKGNR